MSCVKTQSCGTLQLDTMAGYNPQKRSRTKATASGYDLSSGNNFVRGLSGFSLPQTEPTQGNNSGPFWNGTSEGQQCLHSDPTSPHGISHNGFPTSFSSFHVANEVQAGQRNDRSSFSSSRSQWNADLSSTVDHVKMSRYPSQDSVGAQSQRTTHSTVNSYDQNRSRTYSSVPQLPFHISSARSDVTGRSKSPENSGLYTTSPQMDLQVYDGFSYQNGEDLTRSHLLFHGDSTSSMASLNGSLTAMSSYGTYTTSAEEAYLSLTAGTLAGQDIMSQEGIFQSGGCIDSPPMWENGPEFLDSRGSSPPFEDTWVLPTPQLVTSNASSPQDCSPTLEALSPRYVQDFAEAMELPPYTTIGDRSMRKPIGPRQSKVASDLAAASRRPRIQGASETSEESIKLIGRSSLDQDNTAREHPLYHNVTPQADGLYHCPWENEPKANCQHRPEKLKCNYDKFVDSHLKPYKCKVPACKDLQFSSTACLLRHEREAHAMHGHGDKPFLCTHEGCDRGVPGNGFPRHWNLRDHMKRVHNDPGPPKSNASGSPPPSGPAKGKKRKAGESQEPIFVEKSQKRASPPPVVVRQHQGPSLIDRYHEQRQKLLETVTQLQNPADANNLDFLRSANDSLRVMVQTTLKIREAPTMAQVFDSQTG